MTRLTREAITRIAGPIDEAIVAEILATGASEEDLHEARAWLVSDEALLNDLRPLPTGRVAPLVELLQVYEEAPVERE